jgi:predicted heme/steroid binding protein/uncharacterized membrane protein
MKRLLLGTVAGALALAALFAAPATATEEYAACTGRPCAHCHEDPAGGGTLTGAGRDFQAFARATAAPAPSPVRRAVFTLVLFLHILAAFMWFGTILYVHLILKPAYAAGGLPRGELRLGWAGILSVSVTGVLLTVHRLASWHALFDTRFGVLLSVKIGLFLLMAGTAIVVTKVIGPRLGKRGARGPHPGRGDFTPEELAHFDGREGRPALFAFRGKVYDVSGSRLWQGGAHMRRHSAGGDLTGSIGQAPHGEERILGFPAVGALLPAAPEAASPHEKVFYVLAYLNLGIVAAVLLVITLWHV